ncbi:MAG: undecaprenyldiphospho-muramoylpentapeptide beta-N-acetylglucosaminyltransferase [Candidatus Niyogibacteria bacterium]|nr:undecaprenyldiphospho-muramoylpentapeptide beta-N-acetylglucosaminyltransferase [Candidatus Niyogibacteria bacterium]
MKILLTGGGTGGHFYPILAVARALKKLAEAESIARLDLLYLSDHPFNADLLQQIGIRYHRIPAGKMRRYFSILNITDFLKTAVGMLSAIWRSLIEVPDVVFAKGGYASFPALSAARLLNIPVVVHESDTVPGRVNRWAARFAKRVAIAFPEAAEFFPKEKTALVGNPIRSEIIGGNLEEAAVIFGATLAPTVLVLGGSQGSERINNAILAILRDLVSDARVIHQCGDTNYETVAKQSATVLEGHEYRERYRLFGSLDEGELRNAALVATVIVSRAGAGAIFEAAAWGKPAILIPLPESAGDHQRKNAYAYARTGASLVIEESNLTPSVLATEIRKIIQDPERQEKMRTAARAFARPDAAAVLAKEIMALALEHAK